MVIPKDENKSQLSREIHYYYKYSDTHKWSVRESLGVLFFGIPLVRPEKRTHYSRQ